MRRGTFLFVIYSFLGPLVHAVQGFHLLFEFTLAWAGGGGGGGGGISAGKDSKKYYLEYSSRRHDIIMPSSWGPTEREG